MDINFFAIALAAASSLVVGFIWYHEKVFGKAWMQLAGMTPEKIKSGNMFLTLGLSLVFAFMLGLILHGFLNAGEDHQLEKWHTFRHGAAHGMMMGIFVALPIIGINALFEQRNWKYIAIHVGYWLVTMILMSGIISAWR